MSLVVCCTSAAVSAIELSCSDSLVSGGGRLGRNTRRQPSLQIVIRASVFCSHYRGEGAAMAGGPGVQGANRLTTSDALSYLREVKNRFSNNKHIYDTFLEIMKEFKAQR